MQASLPMYDLPELADATAAWWDGIARHAQVQQFLAPPLAPDEVWRRRVLLHASFAGSGPGGPGGGQVFAKLKTLRRQAAVRSRETVWNTIGRLLDAFSPAE